MSRSRSALLSLAVLPLFIGRLFVHFPRDLYYDGRFDWENTRTNGDASFEYDGFGAVARIAPAAGDMSRTKQTGKDGM